jgi:uncharacterized protein (TIGR02117 family)
VRAAALFLFAMIIGTLIPRPFFAPRVFGANEELRTVLLISNAIHTDIAFPADPDVIKKFPFLIDAETQPGGYSFAWVMVGWGGRSFFIETPTWADLKPMPVFRALTIDQSVMHTYAFPHTLPRYPEVSFFTVTQGAFNRMLDKALEGFARDSAGQPVLIPGAAYGDSDNFYEGVGAFNAIVGCNTWTASVLRAGGIKTGWWNMLPINLQTSIKLWNDCDENGRECRPINPG